MGNPYSRSLNPSEAGHLSNFIFEDSDVSSVSSRNIELNNPSSVKERLRYGTVSVHISHISNTQRRFHPENIDRTYTVRSFGCLIHGSHANASSILRKLDSFEVPHLNPAHISLPDSKAASVLVTYTNKNWYAIPSNVSLLKNNGTCFMIGDKRSRELPYSLKVGDKIRLGSVGLLVTSFCLGDGKEESLDFGYSSDDNDDSNDEDDDKYNDDDNHNTRKSKTKSFDFRQDRGDGDFSWEMLQEEFAVLAAAEKEDTGNGSNDNSDNNNLLTSHSLVLNEQEKVSDINQQLPFVFSRLDQIIPRHHRDSIQTVDNDEDYEDSGGETALEGSARYSISSIKTFQGDDDDDDILRSRRSSFTDNMLDDATNNNLRSGAEDTGDRHSTPTRLSKVREPLFGNSVTPGSTLDDTFIGSATPDNMSAGSLSPKPSQVHLSMHNNNESDNKTGLTYGEKYICYMCFEVTDENEDPLIAPCACKGDTRYLHVSCLKKWLRSVRGGEVSGTHVIRETGSGAHACKVCGTAYKTNFRRKSDGRKSSLLHSEHKGPYINLVVVTKHESNPSLVNTRFRINFNPLSAAEGVRIGRSSNCDMILDYRTVSTVHARLFYKEGQFLIEDCQSSNGTMIFSRHPILLPYNKSTRLRMGRSTISLCPARNLVASARYRIVKGFAYSEEKEKKKAPFDPEELHVFFEESVLAGKVDGSAIEGTKKYKKTPVANTITTSRNNDNANTNNNNNNNNSHNSREVVNARDIIIADRDSEVNDDDDDDEEEEEDDDHEDDDNDDDVDNDDSSRFMAAALLVNSNYYEGDLSPGKSSHIHPVNGTAGSADLIHNASGERRLNTAVYHLNQPAGNDYSRVRRVPQAIFPVLTKNMHLAGSNGDEAVLINSTHPHRISGSSLAARHNTYLKFSQSDDLSNNIIADDNDDKADSNNNSNHNSDEYGEDDDQSDGGSSKLSTSGKMALTSAAMSELFTPQGTPRTPRDKDAL